MPVPPLEPSAIRESERVARDCFAARIMPDRVATRMRVCNDRVHVSIGPPERKALNDRALERLWNTCGVWEREYLARPRSARQLDSVESELAATYARVAGALPLDERSMVRTAYDRAWRSVRIDRRTPAETEDSFRSDAPLVRKDAALAAVRALKGLVPVFSIDALLASDRVGATGALADRVHEQLIAAHPMHLSHDRQLRRLDVLAAHPPRTAEHVGAILREIDDAHTSWNPDYVRLFEGAGDAVDVASETTLLRQRRELIAKYTTVVHRASGGRTALVNGQILASRAKAYYELLARELGVSLAPESPALVTRRDPNVRLSTIADADAEPERVPETPTQRELLGLIRAGNEYENLMKVALLRRTPDLAVAEIRADACSLMAHVVGLESAYATIACDLARREPQAAASAGRKPGSRRISA